MIKGKIGSNNVNSKAEEVIATLPMAPSSSPHSKERLAPSICADVPMAKPLAALLLMPSFFNNFGPIIRETRPEKITKKTVVEVGPPRSLETVKAIGKLILHTF
jgi:hypothetical protein